MIDEFSSYFLNYLPALFSISLNPSELSVSVFVNISNDVFIHELDRFVQKHNVIHFNSSFRLDKELGLISGTWNSFIILGYKCAFDSLL